MVKKSKACKPRKIKGLQAFSKRKKTLTNLLTWLLSFSIISLAPHIGASIT